MRTTMHPIKPIRNEVDYDLALQEIDRCLDAAEGSPEQDRLEVLSILVDDYEAKHHSIDLPTRLRPLSLFWSKGGSREKTLKMSLVAADAFLR